MTCEEDDERNDIRIFVSTRAELLPLPTFDGDIAIGPRADGVVCATDVGPLLWHIAQLQIRSLITRLDVESPLDIRFVLRLEVPLVLVIIGIAVGHANQRVLAVFLSASDCAVGGVWYELIKN